LLHNSSIFYVWHARDGNGDGKREWVGEGVGGGGVTTAVEWRSGPSSVSHLDTEEWEPVSAS
jgi:hypothetical protein